MNQVIAGAVQRRLVVSLPMWCAMAEARGEKIVEIRAARALQLQLRILQAVANLIVADFCLSVERDIETRFQACELRIAKFLQRAGRRGVVTVAIDDHDQYIRVGIVHQNAPLHGRIRANFGK